MQPDYEALLELLKARRSVRRFCKSPLPAGTAEKLVEAARWAPSAGNRQAWRVIAVESATLLERMRAAVAEQVERLRERAREDLRELAERYLDHFLHFGQAPLVLVPIFRPGVDLLGSLADARTPGEDALCSVSAAIQNMLLAAQALGLAACWMTGPLLALPALQVLLEVPEGWRIAALLPVGLAGEVPAPPPRRDLDRLLQRPA